jgi:hypothetical protein
MLFGSGELAFTDTSEAAGEAHSRAFPIWGFGVGARAGWRPSERFGAFAQGDVGALTAYVPHDALAVLGFRSAENLNTQLGARAGVEWYQKDRHYALSLSVGARDALGFSKFSVGGDVPLMWDAAAGLRYTF